MTAAPQLRPTRLKPVWLAAGFAAVVIACVAGVAIGPVNLPIGGVFVELFDRLTPGHIDSGLEGADPAIVWELRFPRVVLGLLVGGMLAIAGASYQGVFRNPLADPYLLGVAAGAGLGATVAIAARWGDNAGYFDAVPMTAFAGALLAVAITYGVSLAGGGFTSATSLLLAGIAVASLFTAVQTYVQQQNVDTIREVYSWVLGRLATSGWTEVALVAPYVAVCSVVLLSQARRLDVLSVGDQEASALGMEVNRVRTVVVLAATLGTAAAVAAGGLISFVGIVVPHAIRLIWGISYRLILPLSFLLGGAFLVAADIAARTVAEPAELPIGLVTAFIGAPFFMVVMVTSKRVLS